MKIYYRRPEQCLESIYELQIKTYEGWTYEDLESWEKEDILNECAKDYYDNHDGWEDYWPLTIEVVDNDSEPCQALFSGLVEMEFDPVFGATLNKDEP